MRTGAIMMTSTGTTAERRTSNENILAEFETEVGQREIVESQYYQGKFVKSTAICVSPKVLNFHID